MADHTQLIECSLPTLYLTPSSRIISFNLSATSLTPSPMASSLSHLPTSSSKAYTMGITITPTVFLSPLGPLFVPSKYLELIPRAVLSSVSCLHRKVYTRFSIRTSMDKAASISGSHQSNATSVSTIFLASLHLLPLGILTTPIPWVELLKSPYRLPWSNSIFFFTKTFFKILKHLKIS